MAGTGDPAVEARSRELLRGAVDLHMHTAPDVFPRSVTTYQAAQQAQAAGMRAIVVKSHTVDTAARAEIVRELTGFDVRGGIALNYGVGGLNWHAVRESAWQGGCEVWFPTLSARKFFDHGRSVPTLFRRVPVDREPGLTILEEGQLIDPVTEIVQLIAETGQILSTGHLSPEEGLLLLGAAREAGATRLLVTHPHADFVGYTVEQMREAAELGALMEMHFAFTTPGVEAPIAVSEIASLIRAVGVEHCIIATDGGQAVNPPPVEMLRRFIAGLLNEGFRDDEIVGLVQTRPAALLGLDA
jgi:hypothetical protein